MARQRACLAEYVDKNNVFPSYEVIMVSSSDIFSSREDNLQPGKQIGIRIKNKEPKLMKIIRISDSMSEIKEYKEFLERQDNQVKNVLQMCMRTIKEMKSEQYSFPMESIAGQQSSIPRVISAVSEDSESNSDTELSQATRPGVMTSYTKRTHHQNKRYEPNTYRRVTPSPAIHQRRRSIMSSTPLPGNKIPERLTLYFDQGTQTDDTWVRPSIDKIDEIELVLKHLYGRFQSLVMKVNNSNNETMEAWDSEQNGEVSYTRPNDSWVVHNNIVENVETTECVEENTVTIREIRTEQIIQAETENLDVKVPVKPEADRNTPNESTRVRRMSAQTTYSNEMVAIGSGQAMVPARLMSEIDWTSHTTATRQLLQAIFPRKVLATHSLTGKKSPAHLNKPAKKLLDPNLVEDIINTVSSKSGVPKNLVRNTITVKCTDEAKLYRNRQRFKFSRIETSQQNDENVPPSITHSSDDSSHNV